MAKQLSSKKLAGNIALCCQFLILACFDVFIQKQKARSLVLFVVICIMLYFYMYLCQMCENVFSLCFLFLKMHGVWLSLVVTTAYRNK